MNEQSNSQRRVVAHFSSRSSSLLLLLTLQLAACSVAPLPETEQNIDFSPEWLAEDIPAENPAELTQWWQSFEDPRLSGLIQQALANNPDLVVAHARIGEARALSELVSRRQTPSWRADTRVTARRQSENGPLPVGNIPGLETDQTIHEAGLTTQWELDLFGRIENAIAAAESRLVAAELDHQAMRLALAAEVARIYYSLREATQRLALADARIALVGERLRLLENQIEVGEAAPAVIDEPSGQLAALRARRGEHRAAVRGLELALARLSGQPPKAIAAEETGFTSELRLPGIPVGSKGDMLERRPDVRAAAARLSASSHDSDLARAEHFPELRLSASGGFQALRLDELIDSGSQVFSVSPIFSWRVFDGRRIDAEIAVSDARLQAAAAQYRQSVLIALEESERALSDYHHARESLRFQTEAVRRAESALGMARARFAAGDTPRFPLIQAELGVLAQREAELRIETAAVHNLILGYKSLGGGWEPAT